MIALRFIFIHLILLLFSLHLAAQDILVSDELPIHNAGGYEIIGESQGQTFVLLKRNNRFFVHRFNKQLKRSWEKEIMLDRRSPKVVATSIQDSSFNVYYIARKRSKYRLKIHSYHFNGSLKDSATIAHFSNAFYDFSYNFVESEDKSKILIYTIENNDTFHQVCIDQDSLKLISKRYFRPEKYYAKREPYTVDVSNEGDVFFSFLRNNYKSNRKKHYYKIYHHHPGDPLVSIAELPLRGLLTVDMYSIYDNKNKQLVYAGLYGIKTRQKADGFFYARFNPVDESNFFKNGELDKKFISQFMGHKKVRKNASIYDTYAQESILRQDGGIILLLEQYKDIRRDYNTSAQFRSSNSLIDEYYYNNILLLSIHPNGELHWKAYLPKKQYSQNDNGAFSSYFLFKTKSKLHILFNDEISQDNSISHYSLNGLGKSERDNLLNTKNLNLRLRFKNALQLSNKRLLIPSEWRGQLKLVRIQY